MKYWPWSYSRYDAYEECPKQFSYKYVENLPSPRPFNAAASRGSGIHEEAEQYLAGKINRYPASLQKVAGHAMLLKRLEAKPEQEFCIKEDWTPSTQGWNGKDVYIRAKMDVVYVKDGVLHVEDWKTGQIYDSHKKQLEMYAPIAQVFYPDVTEVRVRPIYIDQGQVPKQVVIPVERLKGSRMLIDAKIQQAEKDENFLIRPGQHCRFCDYSRRFGGPCAH